MLHLPQKHPDPRAPQRGCFRIRWRRALLFVSLAGVLAAGPLWAAESAEQHHVTAVRFWSLGDVTRIAVETDGEFTVRSDRLENPDRIFFDLAGTKPVLGKF